MAQLNRRQVLGAGLAAGAGAALTGCGGATPEATPQKVAGRPSGATSSSAAPTRTGTIIGDGSMSDTGPQPHQPTFARLGPGEIPPQFVVISWDGAGQTSRKLNSYWQDVAKHYNASMTMFLSGIYFLPASKKDLYHPPQHRVGASDIGYFPDQYVHDTIEQTGKAWLNGHEIGTHFNGHFCGKHGGVGTWSVPEWKSEIEQVHQFVAQWKTNTGITDLPPLPFDYAKELVGGRAPCLEGADNLRKAAADLGWRYDSSSARYPRWPEKESGVWDLSMQTIPFPGHSFEIISMDYNFMANQSKVTNGDPAQRPAWRNQTRDAFVAGFRRSYDGNRSPLVIGNHFESWNGGIYLDAVEDAMAVMAKEPDTKFVSFRQLCDWLDAQDPDVVQRLYGLVGAPTGGWDEFLQVT